MAGKNNKALLAALGLGAAYLMRNKESRDKLAKQFETFTNTPMRGQKNNANTTGQETPESMRHQGL
ncbi:hypothetical protein ACF3OH_11550 [Chryseomicrobium aureum]|uniref:hypothetical protein n=1 Tax=Chryseomicrobium aureum TaxID=1441723 RepID=UPI003599D33E